MTISTANTSIKLDVHAPKKDAVVATGAPTVESTEIAVWAGANINTSLVQSIIGGYEALNAYALTNIANITAVVQMPLGGGSGSVVPDGTPDADSIMLYVGSDVVAKQQTHFLDRTFKRLRETWLETPQDAVVVARKITRIGIGNNTWTVNGDGWPAGTQVQVVLTITDPDGQSEVEDYVVTLPPGGPYTAEQAATVLADSIDGLVHYRAPRTGATFVVEPAAPANSVESSIRRV
jgi:hypothetical protein